MSKRPIPFWLIALAVFFLLLCSYLIAPGYAIELQTSLVATEATSSDEDSGAAGLPSDGSSSSQDATEATSSDEDSGAAGLPSDGSSSSQDASEATSSDEDSGAAGEPDASAATETDLQALNQSLENVHADLWLLLFTLWGFAGVFLGYKVGGVVLGRL